MRKKRGGKKMSVNMPTNKTNVHKITLNPDFLKTATRLPVKDGKIVLDRKNPNHVRWAEGYEDK